MLWLPWSPLGCVAAFFAVLDVCQAHNPKDNPEYYVFRGDSRDPDEIREAGGFIPNPEEVTYTNPTTFSLDDHVNGRRSSSAYVSTSAEFGQAARNFAGPGNYVYRIHVTPNMIDVNAALAGGHPYPRQEEASALGGIPWTAVEGWFQIGEDREFPDDYELLNDDSAARLTGRYVAEFADQFEPNRAYDDRGLGGPARLTGADPQVLLLSAQPPDEARLINAATTFMNNHALAIGWTENQAFPYTPPTPPLSDEPVALPDADVAVIPEADREDLAEGRFDNLNCPALAVVLGVTLFQPKGPNTKRYLPRAASVLLKSRDDKKAQCEQLRDVIRRLKPKGSRKAKPLAPAKIVFYGDYLWPEEAKEGGGFLPPVTTPPSPTYKVEGAPIEVVLQTFDWQTEILQTHLLFGQAAQDAAKKASKGTKGFHGIVYAVHATPNMLLSGKDCIAVGGIRWAQVLGWVQVPQEYTVPAKDPKERAKLRQHFENAFKDKNDLFQKNPDYDAKFNEFTTTSKIPDLTLPQAIIKFMDENGKAVGWTGNFPLIDTPERITPEKSKAAKVAKAVTAPHQPSFWEKVGHFFESHIIAIALLPAVAVANLIPGVGEVADAAEFAAFSTETVEGIELAEVSTGGTSELTPLLTKLKVD